ncbi:MAG TPA: hypothetical protein VF846_11905 [Thermoanaerobaculia bacterium]|jgi:hypothetical protein
MAGDIGVHEQLIFAVGDEETVADAHAAQTRVVHHYGPSVRIVAGSPTAEATEAEAPAPAPPEGLDPIGALGLAAFRLRQSPEYIAAKQNRPHEGKPWNELGLERCDLPPEPRHLTRAPETEDGAMVVHGTTSQRMTGNIAVGLVIVSGPGNLAFSDAEKTTAIAEAQNGLSFLANFNPAAKISWTWNIRTPVITTQPQTGSGVDLERLWRDPAMVQLGYSGNWQGVVDYVDWLKRHYNTQWAFVAYITKYEVWHFAYADLGGPRFVMHYQNGNMGPHEIDRVFAHETGHIFQAPDEYGSDCSGQWGVFEQPNGNCGPNGVECIMKYNSWAVCKWTTWHFGWPWPDSLPLGNDTSPFAPAACVFDNKLFAFWRANDESNRIAFTSSNDGLTWPAGARINDIDHTPGAPSACEFNGLLYVFFKSAHSANSLFCTRSSNGTSWPAAATINLIDSAPNAPAACAFNGKLYLFWNANDPSNRIFYSASSSGEAGSWPAGQTINPFDTSPAAPTACVFKGKLYVFWKANDSTNSISYSVSTDGVTFSRGQRINTHDYSYSPFPLGACVVADVFYLFWRGESSNHIYVSASSDGYTWPAGMKVNPVDTAANAVVAAGFRERQYLFFTRDHSSNQIRWTV